MSLDAVSNCHLKYDKTITMKNLIDIELDASEDLQIAGGDFALGESTDEHQKQLIFNNKGDFKQNPTVCVGAFGFLDDESKQNLIRQISVEFTKDGMDVKGVSLSREGIINSNAVYK
jgi:hypothetical protein